MTVRAGGLDAAVAKALEVVRSSGVPAPDALLFAATGAGSILDHVEDGVRIALGEVEGVPGAYAHASLVAGRIGATSVWIVEDAPRTPALDEPAWARAFPVWLAASGGARVVVHLSAGTSLGDLRPGAIARLTDHINLSGASPLTGLGESKLGPLFPDQTRVHGADLAELADGFAAGSEVELAPAIAACTTGPALSTPAELRSYAAAGADVAVQRLADPLIASAHAGLGVLALVAVTDDASERLDVAQLVARAAETAPKLEALALACLRVADAVAAKRREGVSA